MSRIELSEKTLRLVRRIFPPDQHSAVTAMLADGCGSGLPLVDSPTPESLERIRFAVLKLSLGSLSELERAIAVAHSDWRDVLVAAGFGGSLRAHVDWSDQQLNPQT
jgi:hypothetical protein